MILLKKHDSNGAGFTLIEIIIAIALLALLAAGIVTLLIKAGAENTSNGTSMSVAQTPFAWVNKPTEFPKNAPTTFEIELQRFNNGPQRWEPYGEQDSLVGAVTPASVSIEPINADTPSSPTPIPTIPGLSAGGNAHTAETTDGGRITIIAKGSEPADGQLSVIFIRSDGSATHATATFSVTE